MATVDLIIPARNEADNIPALFEAIPRGVFRHIIIADNGSADATAELAVARGAIVASEPKPGYGSACLAGLRWIESQQAPPNIVAFLDADLADDPRELEKIIAPIVQGDAEMVIGCRGKLAQRGALDPHQRFGTALACKLLRWTTGVRYRDLGPMRAVRWSSLKQLDMRDRTWGWTVEMQFKAARRGLRIVQCDVPYRKRRAGKSKISGSLGVSCRAGCKIISTIARLWWHEKSPRA